MERWTRWVLRFRWPIVGFWVAVLGLGFVASRRLSPLLSNTFTVPGTDSERARTILQDHFGDRSDGSFLVVFRVAVFGLSLATTIPFLFAAATIMGTLGIVYGVAHVLVMPTYVTNLVYLIGLGIAIDYSLLVV